MNLFFIVTGPLFSAVEGRPPTPDFLSEEQLAVKVLWRPLPTAERALHLQHVKDILHLFEQHHSSRIPRSVSNYQ